MQPPPEQSFGNAGMIRSLPYQRSFVLLGHDSQVAVAALLMRPLGFEPRPSLTLPGLSGITHELPLVGVDAENRRLLVVQTGADQIPRFYHQSQMLPGTQSPGPPTSLSTTPEEVRTAWLRKSLFTTFDVKAAIETHGWHCSTLFFFDSFEVPASAMIDGELRQWWLDNHMPKDARVISLGAGEPIGELDVSAIRTHIIAAGAAFIDGNQLDPRELGILAGPPMEATGEVVESALAKTRLRQFFRPPLDELLLGTLDKANQLQVSELWQAGTISSRRGHEPSPNTIATATKTVDPLETLNELAKRRCISFQREEVFIEADGKLVAQRWEKTAEESWMIRILRELRIPDLLEVILRSINQGGA